MILRIFLAVLLTYGACEELAPEVASNGNETETTEAPHLDPHDYVVKLIFSFKEEKVPEYIVSTLNSSIAEKGITVSDILRLAGLDRHSLDQTVNLFAHYNISSASVFNVDSLEFILGFARVSFLNFYETLIRKLGLEPAAIVQVLSDLQIDQAKFTGALIFDQFNIYDVLRNGSYTEENVAKALETVKKTKPEAFEIARNIILSEVVKQNPAEFMDSIASLGFNRRQALALWKALNITMEDVYNVEVFRKILSEKIDKLHQNTSVGVIVGKFQLVVHEVIARSCQDMDFIKIETSNGNEVSQHDCHLSSHIVQLRLKHPCENFIRLATKEDYQNVKNNCSYITMNSDGTLLVEAVEIIKDGSVITAKKGVAAVFKWGSPVVCEDTLYGLAGGQDDTNIYFDTFYDNSAVDDVTLSGSTAAISQSLLIAAVLLGVFYKHLLTS